MFCLVKCQEKSVISQQIAKKGNFELPTLVFYRAIETVFSFLLNLKFYDFNNIYTLTVNDSLTNIFMNIIILNVFFLGLVFKIRQIENLKILFND